MPRRLKVALARFRISCHSLEIEAGRQRNVPPENRLCQFCANNNLTAVEDEYHVILQCGTYQHLREMYLGKTIAANQHVFISLLKSSRYEDILSLAHYITSVFRLRKSLS